MVDPSADGLLSKIPMIYFTYAIYNDARNKIYIGHTQNIESRLKRHNGVLKNKNSSFTSKNKGHWILVHKEEFPERKNAVRREKELKSYKGRMFIRGLIKK